MTGVRDSKAIKSCRPLELLLRSVIAGIRTFDIAFSRGSSLEDPQYQAVLEGNRSSGVSGQRKPRGRNLIDVIRDKNLVKPKGTEKRDRHKIKEDRAKDHAHREAVQQQIARDKTEREARQQNEVQERQCAQAASPSPSTIMIEGSEGSGKTECISAWLQFCIPDGSLLRNSFPPDTRLETIKQYIITQLGPSTSSITIYTTYPRQKLSEEDLVKTLAELGLAPSSTLIVAVRK